MATTHDEEGKFRRVSSTSLGTFLDCPYKWWRGLSEPLPPSEAMGVGTLFHAIQEERLALGRMPMKRRIMRTGGNYEDPIESIRRYPDAWEAALRMANEVDPWEAAQLQGLEYGEDYMVEMSVDEFEFHFDGDILAGGFFDLIVPARQEILDWKTRARFSYAPQTFAEFTESVQFLYYAAVAERAFGWDSVRVTHLNVQRPTGRFRRDGAELPGYLLREVWEVVDVEIVPHMKRVAAELEDAERNAPAACYKYGPCRFLSTCEPNPEGDLFAGLDSFDDIFDELEGLDEG